MEMDKWTKVAIVATFTWGFVAGMYMLIRPDLPQIGGCIIAIFAAVVVGMFYAKEK